MKNYEVISLYILIAMAVIGAFSSLITGVITNAQIDRDAINAGLIQKVDVSSGRVIWTKQEEK